MTKIICLLLSIIMGSIPIFGGGGPKNNNEMVVLDAFGDVSILQITSNGPMHKEIASNVYGFNICRSGHFVMRDIKTNSWIKGRIDSSLNITKQAISPISLEGINTGQSANAAISEDGKRIAWTIGYPKTDLIVQEYDGDQAKIIRTISTKGIVLLPSWSPNGHLLAYYYGPPEAQMRDGFSLMLISVDDPDSQPVSVAPPSLHIGMLNPTRSERPLWSPNGKSILFQGRYRDDEPYMGFYVVSVDGTNLMSSIRGGGRSATWDREGMRVYSIGRNDLGLDVITDMDVLENQGKENYSRTIKLSDKPKHYSVSPSGEKVSYLRDDRELFIYDAATDQTIPFGRIKIDLRAKYFWINPSEQ